MKIFRYIPEVDAFDVTDEYRAAARDLGLSEWNDVCWLGRLFMMDNDLGEHWFDNWELRDKNAVRAGLHGFDVDRLLFINPERFQDGRDGPCHSATFRKRFWTCVLESLELDPELLFDEARAFNAWNRERLDEDPSDPEIAAAYLTDLETRIDRWKRNLGGQGGGASPR